MPCLKGDHPDEADAASAQIHAGWQVSPDRLRAPPAWRQWQIEPPVAIQGMWGSGPGEVWAVGDAGTILRYQPWQLIEPVIPVPCPRQRW